MCEVCERPCWRSGGSLECPYDDDEWEYAMGDITMRELLRRKASRKAESVTVVSVQRAEE